MSVQTLLSIIIPTFNSGSTLEVALKSISAQDFSDVEVIIMDAVSTDETLIIARKYRSILPILRIFSEPDSGIYDAMNKSLLLAKGKWLYFMGSDDSFYSSNVLKEVFKSGEEPNCDVLYGNVYSTRFNGIYDGSFSFLKLVKKNICHQGIFFRKSVFSKIGNFDLRYKSHADWDHNIRWFFSSKVTIIYVDIIIANYADGGFSSLEEDKVFKKEKYWKLLIAGWNKLPLPVLLELNSGAINQTEISNPLKHIILKISRAAMVLILRIKSRR